jgi:hypothetical protein
VQAENAGVCLKISGSTETEVRDALLHIAEAPLPDPSSILDRKTLGCPEKWDWALSDRLFFDSFVSSRLDLAAAHELASKDF